MMIKINRANVFIGTSGKEFVPGQRTWVFIHGSAMDHTIWALFNRYFTSIGINVLAVDLPGHGRSGGKPLNKIEDLSDWLLKVFDKLEIQNAIVAGHSMGALIAYDFAARHKQRCQGAVLLGFCLPMPVNQALLDLSKANDHRAFEMIVDFGYAPNSKIGAAQSPGLWMTQSGMRLMEHSREGTLFSDFTACNDYTPPDGLAADINCPVLFIAGSEDKMTPVRGLHAWLEKVKNSQLELIASCGHMMTIEKPNQVIAAFKRFNHSID
jgi:pimeloyl-ACP methyl ester carboxylesterase